LEALLFHSNQKVTDEKAVTLSGKVEDTLYSILSYGVVPRRIIANQDIYGKIQADYK
jgi:hypothetical protein